jgi:integrase
MEPSAPNIKAAARLLEAVKHDIAMGKFDYLDHFPNSKHAMRLSSKAGHLITVDKLLNDWLKRVANRAAYSTLKDYSSAVRYHLVPRFGAMRVAELKTSQIEDWLAELRISGKRKNNILIPLRQAFEDALFEGLIDRNPMDRVRSAKQVRSEPEPFTKAEAQRII